MKLSFLVPLIALLAAPIINTPAQEAAQPAAPAAVEPIDPALEQRIRRHIAQLGDPEWIVRNQATADLKAIGKPAVPYLTEARNSPDPEVAVRAQEVLDAINPPPPPPQVGRRGVAGHAGMGGMMLQIGAPVAQQTAVVTRAFAEDDKQYRVTRTTENQVTKIRVEITEVKDGKVQQRVVEADSDAALEKQDPELAKVLKRNENAGVVQMQARAAMQMGANVVVAGHGAPLGAAKADSLDLMGGFGTKLLAEADGVRVTDIKAGSTADNLGIKIGDFLSKVNMRNVGNLQEAQQAFGNLAAETPLIVEVRRNGQPLVLKSR